MLVKCLECGKEFKRLNTFHLRKHGLNEKSYLQKYPDAKIFSEECKELISQKTKKGMRKPESWEKFKKHIDSRDILGEKNPFFGKKHSNESKKKISQNKERSEKISKKRKEWWSTRKGKTVEELFGEEKGKEIRKIKSIQTKGENNPAYGKVYKNTGKKIGKYKGKLFRSVWEYSFYKYWESLGFEASEVQYESIKIKYVLNGIDRVYIPDFLIERRLIEVKSEYRKKIDNNKILIKKRAAEKWCKENGYTYEILTEKDFPVLTYAQAYSDPDVEWIRK